MTPADKRIAELLDRWLTSVELHLKYLALDEASYRQIQAWPEHERPTRWILEIAQQKTLQLKSLLQMHTEQQDGSFAEGLELMCFLANLVGVQNIKRYIPLAELQKEKTATANPAPTAARSHQPIVAAAPKAPVTAAPSASAKQESVTDSATRELPALKPVPTITRENDSTREMPRLQVSEKKPEPPRQPTAAKRAHSRHPQAKFAMSARASDHDQQIVVADAIRLLKWGKEWHELADLIARMAERPGASEVRRILKTQRKSIERQLMG